MLPLPLLTAALAGAVTVSPNMAHEIRVSGAFTRPAGDMQLDAVANFSSESWNNGSHVNYLSMPISLRVGVTDWFELEGSCIAAEHRDVAAPFVLRGPEWQAVPAVGAHASVGWRPSPTSGLALQVGGSTHGLDDDYQRSTLGFAQLLAAAAVTPDVLVRPYVRFDHFLPQIGGSYDRYGTGFDVAFVGDETGLALGASLFRQQGVTGWDVSGSFLFYPTRTSEIFLTLQFNRDVAVDSVVLQLGTSLEPLTRL